MINMKTSEIMSALAEKYAPPAWALLPEVRNSTGFQRTIRTADALAMSLYPSRGIELHGFEVKASRTDWLKELSQPDKAEEICQFCDRWWIVVGDAAIVKAGELPPTWGLLVPRGGKLVVATEAPKLEAKPLTKLFLAGVMRKLSECSATREELASAFDRGVKQGIEAEKSTSNAAVENAKRQVQWAKEEADRVTKCVSDFETASGLQIRNWQAGRVGNAVSAIMNGDVEQFERRLAAVLGQAEEVVRAIRHAQAGVELALPEARQVRPVVSRQPQSEAVAQ